MARRAKEERGSRSPRGINYQHHSGPDRVLDAPLDRDRSANFPAGALKSGLGGRPEFVWAISCIYKN
jgi:hypothetical protein